MTRDGYWVHDLNPIAVQLWGGFAIHWYGLAYLAGIMLGWWLLERWRRQQRLPLAKEDLGDFVMWAAIGMMVGGRLAYCALYIPDEVAAAPLKIFKVWEGGMASHGGMVGFAVGIGLYAWRRQRSFLVLGDAVAAVAPIGICFGRLANFVNGELYGRPGTVPWAMIFPSAQDGLPRHPSQLYAAGLEGALLAAVLLSLHHRHRRPGLTMGLFFVLYALGRFVGEFWREPDRGQPGSPGVDLILGLMTKGQALTVPLLLIGLALCWWALRRSPQPAVYAPSGAP